MNLNDYVLPESVAIDDFFKKKSLRNWTLPNYFEWRQKSNPFAKFSSCKQDFQNALKEIKTLEEVPRNVKTLIEPLALTSKNQAKGFQVNHTVTINYNDNATHNGNNICGSTSDIESSGKRKHDGSYDSIEIAHKPDEDALNNWPICSLYKTMYKLYKNEQVDLNGIKKVSSGSMSNQIYNACTDLMANFYQLNTIEKARLHVLLSSCLNMVETDYQPTLTKIIGEEKLQMILGIRDNLSFSLDNAETCTLINEGIKMAFEEGKLRFAKIFVLNNLKEIYEKDLEQQKWFALKLFDAYNFILDEARHKKWRKSKNMEEDVGFYWKHLLEILFRGTGVILRKGESTCSASKMERQLNEFEYGALSQNVFGRKIDLLLLTEIDGEKGEPFEIELSSIEVKPVGVPSDVEVVQLNKNIRVNKSILHNIKTHMGGSGEDTQVLGMDVVGLDASMYALFQYEDVVVSVPVIGNLFLPSDELEFEDFVESEVMCRLLQFVDFHVKLVNKIQKASKKYRRSRYSSRYSNLSRMSPPVSPFSFPKDTFYTPKRSTT